VKEASGHVEYGAKGNRRIQSSALSRVIHVSLQEEEALWTEIIERYGGLDANWVPDLVGRAWCVP
jgi:hypothetical protein